MQDEEKEKGVEVWESWYLLKLCIYICSRPDYIILTVYTNVIQTVGQVSKTSHCALVYFVALFDKLLQRDLLIFDINHRP